MKNYIHYNASNLEINDNLELKILENTLSKQEKVKQNLENYIEKKEKETPSKLNNLLIQEAKDRLFLINSF